MTLTLLVSFSESFPKIFRIKLKFPDIFLSLFRSFIRGLHKSELIISAIFKNFTQNLEIIFSIATDFFFFFFEIIATIALSMSQ